MQILVLAHRVPYPPNKGEKIRTYHQIEFLRRCGHEIVVYAVGHDSEDAADAATLAGALDIEVCVDTTRFRWWRLLSGLFSARTLSVCNFRSGRLQKRLDARLRHAPPDAILCTGSAMASYVFANRSLQDSTPPQPALIMDFMDLDSDKWDQYRRHSRFPMSLLYRREAWLLARYERRINALFSSCLFVSRNEVDLFLARGLEQPARVSVVGNGVDMDAFYPEPVTSEEPAAATVGQRAPDMVFTGVMDYRPNEDAVSWFLNDTWARLRERWPEARFTIAGMAPSEQVLELGRLPGVVVTGKVDTVLPYFHRANLFVAPFRLARGLQNKVLQAFACGVPVITSASGAEGIDGIDGRHLIIAETADDYIEAIASLMNEPARYRSIRDNALALVREHYSWDGQNRALLNCLPQRDTLPQTNCGISPSLANPTSVATGSHADDQSLPRQPDWQKQRLAR